MMSSIFLAAVFLGELDISGTGTTINGASSLTVKGVRSIVISLKGGNDTVTYSAFIAGSITFNGGGGTNELEIDSGSIGGSVNYVNGSASANEDNLTIFGSNIHIGRDIIADFGEGTSWALFSGVTVGGKVVVTGGSGAGYSRHE